MQAIHFDKPRVEQGLQAIVSVVQGGEGRRYRNAGGQLASRKASSRAHVPLHRA
jgi:hypothetical protein